MHNVNLKKARDFILLNARLIERHLFSFHFEKAPPQRVRAALTGYCHESGLYGFGLEPDKRATDPQPIDQAIALEILDTIEAKAECFISVCNGLSDLSNGDGGLPFSHPSVETAPHAFWWDCPQKQPSSINPTGIILSLLWKNTIHHPWMDQAETFCWDAINHIPEDSSHSLLNALAFLSQYPDQDHAYPFLQGLGEKIRTSTNLDPHAEGYVVSPPILLQRRQVLRQLSLLKLNYSHI